MESHGVVRRARYADGILSTELDGSRFGGAVHHVDHRHYSKQQLSELLLCSIGVEEEEEEEEALYPVDVSL